MEMQPFSLENFEHNHYTAMKPPVDKFLILLELVKLAFIV